MTCTFLFPCAINDCSTNKRLNNNRRAVGIAASAFQSLDVDERDRVARDLYGTEEPIEEEASPGFIQSKLDDLENELELLNETATKYYNLAVEIERQKVLDGYQEEYVTSRKFRLMFLRAERFDTKQAAARLASYFHEKYFLFGEEVLARKITQQDFTYSDMGALVSGAYCFTGATDLAGRPIILVRRKILMKQDIESMKRVLFYVVQNSVEDNDIAQQKGVVFILYNVNAPVSHVPSEVRRILSLPRLVHYSLPLRIVGIHNFYDNIKEHMVMNFILAVLSKDNRARFQGHFLRSQEECMCTLMEYGIQYADLPLDANTGEVCCQVLQSYWEKQQQLEQFH